jgi:hypothetical protein
MGLGKGDADACMTTACSPATDVSPAFHTVTITVMLYHA